MSADSGIAERKIINLFGWPSNISTEIPIKRRKCQVYFARQPTLFGKHIVWLLPIRGRQRERVRQRVSPSAIKRDTDCFTNLGLGQGAGMNQENHVHKVSHAGIRRALSRQGIRVQFFGKLLLARDHVQRRARNTSKRQPIAPFDDFQRLNHSVAYSYV
jgi:hypothetical protein